MLGEDPEDLHVHHPDYTTALLSWTKDARAQVLSSLPVVCVAQIPIQVQYLLRRYLDLPNLHIIVSPITF